MIINSQPNNWQNVYNEMVFGLESTNATAAGFQFLVDINVSGQTNPVARLTYPKQPGINTIDVDVSEVLRNYVSYDFASYNASGIYHCINSKVDYWVEFGEVRNNASGIPVIYPNLTGFYASGNNAHSTNAIFDFLDWSKTAFIDYNVNSPIESGLTLNQTTFQEKLRYGEERFLTYFDYDEIYGTGIVGNINVQVLDKNLNLLIESNAGFTPIGSINSINVANSGNASGYYKSVYDAAFDYPNAVYYRVNGQNTAGSGATTYFSRTFLIDTSCQKYSPIRLHWLNNLGGFDAYTFTKVSRNFTDIERKMFKKFQPLNYPKTFRAKTNYYTKSTDTITINSDGLTDAEWIGLKELVLSPVVMMEYGATYIPVNIKESNYEEKIYINDRQISSLQLTIEYTFDNYRQSL
jgi:hypothetical protein